MPIPVTTQRRRFIFHSAAAVALRPHVSWATDSDRIKIGQIGTRHAHASGKLASIRKLHDLFEVVGVVEPDAQRRQSIRDTGPYAGLSFLTEEELLNTPGLAAVAVETDVESLVATATRCLSAGVHVHLDKPAGTSMRACRAMHRAASARNLTVQMGYMLRYNPAFVRLFDMVADGWLGPITELSASMGKKAPDSTRKELSRFAGGGMFELACHVIDAMVSVLGKPDRTTAVNHQSYPEKDNFADNQLALFEYPHAIATIRCNHLDPFGFPRRFFEVAGEQGTFQINPLEPPSARVALDRAHGDLKKGFQDLKLPKSSGRYDDEFRDLARVIRGEKQLRWDAEHDLTVQEAVLRASGMPLDD